MRIPALILIITAALTAYVWPQYSYDDLDMKNREENAARYGEEVAPPDELPSVTGEVVSMNPRKKTIQISVSTRNGALMSFGIDNDTTYTGIKSIGELGAGDTVEITYQTFTGVTNVADDIALKKRAESAADNGEDSAEREALESVLGGGAGVRGSRGGARAGL